jgi:serine/threonine protein kinase
MSNKPTATKENFVLPEYLKFKRHLGSGAYGVVCACTDDRRNGEEVAVKKIMKVFDRKIITKRTLREIKLLREFQGHENIISVLDVFKLGEDTTFNEIYVVQELMEADMHQIIRSRQKLTNSHFQYFVYQMLRGLKFIHAAGVIHRDLKPGNLLVNSDCGLKICDFGLARGISLPHDPEQNKGMMTEYVATRWYRAPEIMLSSSNYSKAIDVWSVGCIFAELLGGKVLFPGKDYVNQMSLIINVLGTPSDDTLNKIGSERAKEWVHNMPFREKIPFSKIYPDADPAGLDLLEKLLEFDPYKRITVEEALKHPYLALYHDPLDEPSRDVIDFSFESLETIEDMRTVLAKEIKTHRPTGRHVLQRQGSKNLSKPPIKEEEKVLRLNDDMKNMEIENGEDNDIETQLAQGVARPLDS